MAGSPHVAVIGGGILGSSIAVNLIRKGCKVTVIEAAASPGEGATSKSWAWLNANRKTPSHYKELNKAGMKEWADLSRHPESGEKFAEFPGTIYIGDDRKADTEYPSESLQGPAVLELEPEISSAFAAKGGRLYKQEGYGYPALAAAQFLQEAEQQGAAIHFSSEVVDFSTSGERVTVVQASATCACKPDFVVLAAGLGIPALAKKLGVTVPLQDKVPTLTVLTQPLPRILHHIIVTDEAFILQRRDGEVMISFFKAAVNHSPAPVEPSAGTGVADAERDGEEIAEHIREGVHEAAEGHNREAAEHLNASDAVAQREIARAAKICPALKDASLGSFSLAKYPYPADAHPILGWLPGFKNVYVAVTHSGATLGPYLGRLVAQEILGSTDPSLEHYRPDRDFSNLSHLY